ncbi:MAG: bifunctional DNA-formamidopyrimidine glycosylase/DNA-(apurinic or apyrimidinic site) lyase [Pseudomonadota bacterium]
MPELPEVETIVRELDAVAAGRKVDRLDLFTAKIARPNPDRLVGLVQGAVIEGVERRAKFIVFRLSGGARMVVHLKMTGKFLLGRPLDPGGPPKHVHVSLTLDDGQVLWYEDIRRFGFLWGLSAEEFDDWLAAAALGPEPFQLSAAEFAERLGARRGRIKPLLLNQRFLGGLGNIYVDESLFAAGIHPLRPAESLSPAEARRLHGEIVRILDEAIRLRGSTVNDYKGITGAGGEYQHRHQVYGKTGEASPECGGLLERLVVGGRGTHCCPACQIGPDSEV